MKRKYYYGVRILYNLVRVPLRRLLYFHRLQMPIIQNMSPSVIIRVFGDGQIHIRGRLTIEDNVLIEANGGSVDISSCFINRHSTIISLDSITIRKGTTIGPNVCIYDHDHNISDPESGCPYSKSAVVIEENVWIGANAVVLKGVHVGEGAVIAAGAVVREDVEAFSVVGGVPAKKIGINRCRGNEHG